MFEKLAIAFAGLLAGMLVNYLADTLPVKRRLAQPICNHCGQKQGLQNYLIWPRRCVNCGKRRPPRVWFVELGFAALFLWVWLTPDALKFIPFWMAALLLIFFGVVAVIDMELRLILHPVSMAGVALGLLMGITTHGLWLTLAGGLGGFLIMYILFGLGVLFTRLTRKLQGNDEEVALGFGDVNLAGVLGLILGWPQILMGLLLSVLAAGVISLVLVLLMIVLRRYRAFLAIPYGPFLILGAFILLFLPHWGQVILARAGPLFWIGN